MVYEDLGLSLPKFFVGLDRHQFHIKNNVLNWPNSTVDGQTANTKTSLNHKSFCINFIQIHTFPDLNFAAFRSVKPRKQRDATSVGLAV